MNFLHILQAVVSLVLILLVIIQQRGESIGFLAQPSFTSSRRGVEKGIFILTFIFGFLFIFLALWPLLIR
ncbi:MAG: preprotein translocase subunit SecG [Minisyncoccia bacterium]